MDTTSMNEHQADWYKAPQVVIEDVRVESARIALIPDLATRLARIEAKIDVLVDLLS
jgi:hypothetical protein